MSDFIDDLCKRVELAARNNTQLRPVGGGTKNFYGGPLQGEEVDMRQWAGIVEYEPTELVITVKPGTLLAEVEAALAAQKQELAFEPPRLGTGGTVGGAIASGLAGPARLSRGGVKDYVLGCTLLDGKGQLLHFGGVVMKNVAGYDVSRLLAGSFGIFGAIAQVSLKVAPKPLETCTLEHQVCEQEALDVFHSLRAQPLPIRSTAWEPAADGHSNGIMRICLSGATAAVRTARAKLGGDLMEEQAARGFWDSLRDHQLEYFSARPLWRVAVAPGTPALGLGPTLIEWGGGQRWMNSDLDPQLVRSVAKKAGGHATLFRPKPDAVLPEHGVFQPLEAGVLTIVQRLKHEFDPKGLFNPGRLVMGV